MKIKVEILLYGNLGKQIRLSAGRKHQIWETQVESALHCTKFCDFVQHQRGKMVY